MSKKYIRKIVLSGVLVSLVTFPLSSYIEAAEVNSDNSGVQSEKPNKDNVEYDVPVHEVKTYKEFVNSKDPSVSIDPNNLTQDELQKLGFSQAEAEEMHPSVSFRSASTKNWSRKFTTGQLGGVLTVGTGASGVAQALGKLIGGPVTAVSAGVATIIVGVLNASGAKGIQVGGKSYIQKTNPRTGTKFKKPRRVYQPTWAKPYY